MSSLDDEINALFGLTEDKSEEKSAGEQIFDMFRQTAFAQPVVEEPEIDFDSEPEMIEANNALAQAKQAFSDAQAAMADIKQQNANFDADILAITAQIMELQEKVRKVKQEREALNASGAVLDRRRAINAAERAVREADSNISVVRQKIELRAKTLVTVEQFTRIAENYSWYTGFDLNGKHVKVLPHQWEGIKFLANAGRAILGDEMGLGKTIEAIAALDLVQSKRALVICPAEVTSNFLREVKRWAPHRKVVNIKGETKVQRNLMLSMAAHFEPVVVIVNYEAWRKDLSLLERLIDLQFDTIIADEAHSIKGTNTDAFSGLKRVALCDNTCPFCGSLLPLNDQNDRNSQRWCSEHHFRSGDSVYHLTEGMDEMHAQLIAKSVKQIWLMTGTPILNSPEDLWPMLHLIDPRAFSYKVDYLRVYCLLTPDGKYIFKPGGLESLTKKLSGRYLARTLDSAGVVLPPQDIIEHFIEFDDDTYLMQQDIIRQLKKYHQIVLSENNKMSTIDVLPLILRQRQANVWPGGIKVWEWQKDEFGIPMKDLPKLLVFDASAIKESIKMDTAMNLIMEHGVVEGHRIAVFSQFKTALAELERRIKEVGLTVVRFDGDTPDRLKEEVKTNFDKSTGEAPKWQIVLANYKTGGVGLNLTAATHTIILDEEWNPGKRDQAYKRTQRMGQDENTFVHVIRVLHTIDTWLMNLIGEKEDMILGFDSATKDIQHALLEAIKDGEI